MASNISKWERARRPPKPEFAWTGVLIGLFLGWLGSVFVEAAIGRPKMIIMFIGGFGGFLLGFGFEGIRYWIKLRRYRFSRKP